MLRVASIFVALTAAGAPLFGQDGSAPPGVATISGAIFDSLALRPMARAVVQLARLSASGRVDGTWSVASDSAGRFAFESVQLGSYLLGFQHLAIDTLGIRSPVHRVDVRRGGTTRVPLAVPTMRSIVETACGKQSATDSVSLLVGSVRQASTDAAVVNAYVSVKWSEVYLSRAGMVREMPTHDLRTNEEGWFMACVPSGIPVTAHAEQDTLRSGDVELVMSTQAIRRRDLYIGAATVKIVSAEDSVRTSGAVNDGDRVEASGTGTLRGVVRALDGKPIPGARVRMIGARGESRTDSAGAFTLRALPHGTHAVEARALGFLPDEAMVDVLAFREQDVTLTLTDLSSTLLDTVRVRGAARMAQALRAGFERRRRSGMGTFLEELDTLKVQVFADIVARIPGLTFREGRNTNDAFERQLFFSGGGRSEPCAPTIYLDGIQLLQQVTDVDQLVNAATIRRVEVYLRGTTPPAEFASSSGCGIMVIWTTPRTPGPRKRS